MRRRSTPTTSSRSSQVAGSVEEVWAIAASGRLGPQWYVDGAPWVVRGGLDRLVGGSGRSHPPPGRVLLQAGDRAGFWLIEEADHDSRRLVLRAEVKAPGEVRLTTTVAADGVGSRISQRVELRPSGILGLAYLALDLPARETVIELAHRRLLRDLL